jgi:hypothetical protein
LSQIKPEHSILDDVYPVCGILGNNGPMDTPQAPHPNSPQEEFNHRRADHARDTARKLHLASVFYEQAALAFESQDERNGELKLRSARQALEPIADELPRPPQPAKPRPVEKPKMDWGWFKYFIPGFIVLGLLYLMVQLNLSGDLSKGWTVQGDIREAVKYPGNK